MIDLLSSLRSMVLLMSFSCYVKLCETKIFYIAECYSDPSLSNKMLGWEPLYNLERMLKDHWRWQSQNPDGYIKSSE